MAAIGVVIAAIVAISQVPGGRAPKPAGGKQQNAAVANPNASPEPDDQARGARPKLPFKDITRDSGIEFVHDSGAAGDKMLPESGGAGCAFVDYDADGDPDLLLLNGRPWPWDEDQAQGAGEPRNCIALYRNEGGQFANVAADVGLSLDFVGQGIAVGDYDADGDDDFFFTAVGENRLYRNDAGRFIEVGREAGVAGNAEDWTTSAGFFDYDRDGDLDLFVCNYLRWSRELDQQADVRIKGAGRSYAHPSNFPGTHNYLYRNDGGKFVDVSAHAGVQVVDAETGAPLSKALAATFVDVDADGWLDVFVANDTTRHFLFRNRGDGTFEEVGQDRGTALNADGATTSGMGVDASWLRNSDQLAMAVGNFANEMTELYVAQGGSPPFFVDDAVAAGIGEPSRNALTFGVLMDDIDLDGRVDLVQANGHLEETINQVQPGQQYAQPAQLFWNAGAEAERLLVEIPQSNIGDLAKPIVGRGLACADLDGDGDLDLVLTQVGGSPLLLRNDLPARRHWLRCRLQGPPGNPHAIGATIELRTGNVTQRRLIMPTRSYLSQTEPIATFGLGEFESVDDLKVTWPDGSQQSVGVEEVDQLVAIEQLTQSFSSLANRAKAELENGEYEPAIKTLEAALELQPQSLAMRRNLVRAHLLSGRIDDAVAELDRLDSSAPPSAALSYLRGLAMLRQNDFQGAEEQFTRAIAFDPDESTLRFQHALALLGLNRRDEAVAELKRTVEREPLHGSAQYQLATLARRAGDQAAFSAYMRDYLRIRDLRGAASAQALEQCVYTAAEAAEADGEPPVQSVRIASRFESTDFVVRSATDGPGQAAPLSAAAALSVLDSGLYQLASVTTAGELLILECDERGACRELARSAAPLGELGDVASLLVGNAFVDPPTEAGEQGDYQEIAVVTPQRSWLLRYVPGVGVLDLTPASNLASAGGRAGRWIDLDHDGDIDLCLAGDDGVHVWRNNSDGTFVEATADFGLTGAGRCLDLAAADFDGTNVGVELAVVGGDAPILYRNQMAGQFSRDDEAVAQWPAAERVLLDDFTNDGLPDALLVSARRAALISSQADALQEIDVALDELLAAARIDVDNDGWLDAAVLGRAAGETKGFLIRNAGGRLSTELEDLPIAETMIISSLLDLDIDGDGDTDLAALGGESPGLVLRNITESPNRQLKLSLRSFAGHPSSIGVRVQIRRNDFVVSRWTDREAPIEIGVDANDEVDSVQTLWMNGVLKNEIGVQIAAAPLRVSIVEFIRTDSCPWLYCWRDGQWRFVNDLLGGAPLNVAVARGVPMPPDPDEAYVLGPREQFTQDDDAVKLRISSELREVIYLDSVRLLAVDHPRDCRVFSLDRIATSAIEGPKLVAGRDSVRLRTAIGSDGIDRTAPLAATDGVFAAPGHVLPPPSVGFTKPLSLELDFGPLDSKGDLFVALTGWFRFGSSSANIASSQRTDLQVIWPKLEAEDAGGQWRVVDEMVGLPAGNTKTIVCSLADKLPPGARRLRLTTSFEVRWDCIELYHSVPGSEIGVTDVPLAQAELGWHGFGELAAPQPDHPQAPRPDRLSNTPRWLTTVAGWCTRYGDILPLVATTDRRLAILNSGDGATLTFSASGLQSPGSAEQRTLVLFSHGWIKAADPNSLPDLGVEPFPGSDVPVAEGADDWQLEFNTRWVPSRPFVSR